MGAGFSIYARDAGKRAEVFIYEDVGEGWFGGFTAKQFSEELTAIGKAVTHIDVRINSYGGDVFDGLTIYNLLVQHSATVHTHVDGIAASIASIIAMAGDKVHMAENAQFMIHNAWSIAMGDAEAMRRKADVVETMTAKLAQVYVARTRMAEVDVRALMAAETWMTAEQALERGFVDSVVENLRVAACAAPPALYGFKRAPARLSAAGKPVVSLSADELALRDEVHRQQQRLQRHALAGRNRPASGATVVPLGTVTPAGGTRAT